MPPIGKMVDWEEGNLSRDEEIELFQILINSGMAWQLQGMYGRNASRLIARGDCYSVENQRSSDMC